MAAAAAGRLGVRASGSVLRAPGSVLRAPARSLAANAGKPASTAGAGDGPTPNMIWLERQLSEVSSVQGARFAALHREVLDMQSDLEKARAAHAAAISESKRAAAETVAWSVCVGGAFLTAVVIFWM